MKPYGGDAEWSYTTGILKYTYGDYNSFFHVRFYGNAKEEPQHANEADDAVSFRGPDGYNYMIGTCHMDINEAISETYPDAFPRPEGYTPGDFASDQLWQLSGASQKVEEHIAARLRIAWGASNVQADGPMPNDPWAVNLGNADEYPMFQTRMRKVTHGGHGFYWSMQYRMRQGKWWCSNGYPTILTLPKGWR